MEDRTVIIIVALALLAALEAFALHQGMDGAVLAAVIGIFGFVIGVPAGAKILA